MEHVESLKYIDLQLPKDKSASRFKSSAVSKEFFKHADNVFSYKQKEFNTAVVGTKDVVYSQGDTGLFGTLFEAWANHWNVRTSPEDWWLPVITKVAKQVDNYADTPELRGLFVGGREGKEEIVVECPSFTVYDTDYTFLFDQFSKGIDSRIKVPGYVSTIGCDFSTTTPDQLIASQITLMKSVQKYFDYTMMMCGCGIKGLEMAGTEQDWVNLKVKLRKLIELLKPVESTLNLKKFFSEAETVMDNLLKTYRDGKSMKKWWADILIKSKDYEYGPSGMHRTEVDAYNGWLVHFLSGAEKLKARNFKDGKYADELSCLSSCPLKIVDVLRGVSDNSTLVAGMLGYKVHENTANGVVSLQPAHGWCMLLPVNSPLIS